MAFSPAQRAAIFEKLKNSKMNKPQGMAAPKPPMPISPMSAPKAPAVKQMSSFNDIPQQAPMRNQVNQNFIGNGKAQRFMKLKKLQGF